MWKAIRYRGGQSLVLVLISALVATCAAFAPLFSRSIDQALLRATLGRLEAADLKLGVLATRTTDPELTRERGRGRDAADRSTSGTSPASR